MKQSIHLTLRSAAALLTVRTVFQQIALGLLVFSLSVVWLRVPDASVLDVVGSVLLGLILLAVAGGGEALLILRLCSVVVTPKRLLRGALFLLVGLAVWYGFCAVLDHLSGDDSLRAGYFNSRFPHSLRNFFSYRHIMLWFGWMWAALEWISVGMIAIVAVSMTASSHPVRAMLMAVRSITYWIALFAGVIVATRLTSLVIGWVPGKGLGVELSSLMLRLVLVVLLDATVVSFLLCIVCALVRASDGTYTTPAGTPVLSQSRTADMP